ncbi:unnamed protein product [Echinostoma caproni]|uniref:Methyltranfer_dom domain-containing protein n=1 Tax=Echinostoma caproni TaxID=27848 RepID=A0A183AGE9_9TREM|nr:unnamed protein product [Echinostoma caproni]
MQHRKIPPRLQCIIVINLPEAEATTAQARLDHALQLLRWYMVTLFDGDDVETAASIRVKLTFRLGKPRQDNSLRPLKVVLRVGGETKAILQRTHKLKETPVRFLRDLDPDHCSKLKTALEEVTKRRAKQESDLCIRDFRIHRKRPQLLHFLYFMNYAAKVINGSLRYRAIRALESILRISPKCQDGTPFIEAGDDETTLESSVAARLRKHPFFLSLPALTLPSQLDRAAINYLREHSLSSPKAIEDRAEMLGCYLWSRQLMTESGVVQSKRSENGDALSIGSTEEVDLDLAEAIRYHNPDALTKMRSGAAQKVQAESLEQWKSLTPISGACQLAGERLLGGWTCPRQRRQYHPQILSRYLGHNCELYLTARLAPNFASACRVLYEIRKRCPQFIPRNMFDFGSGLGTQKYDLVVSAHSLLELPGKSARERVLSNLWGRTSNFLVLIEQGTRAGFAGILEARDWLCPHSELCGKRESVCNISVRYYHFGLTRLRFLDYKRVTQSERRIAHSMFKRLPALASGAGNAKGAPNLRSGIRAQNATNGTTTVKTFIPGAPLNAKAGSDKENGEPIDNQTSGTEPKDASNMPPPPAPVQPGTKRPGKERDSLSRSLCVCSNLVKFPLAVNPIVACLTNC